MPNNQNRLMKQLFWVSILSLFAFSCSSNNSSQEETVMEPNSSLLVSDTTKVSRQHKELPFIGKKMFETRPGVSGTGTPQYYIEILENGDTFFSFGQHDMSNNSEIAERYYAGKFTPYIKSIFKKLDNEVRYYYVTRDTIYEVDENHKRLISEECCNIDQTETECPCQSEYYSI